MSEHYTFTRQQLASLLRETVTEADSVFLDPPISSAFDNAGDIATHTMLALLDQSLPAYEQALLAYEDGDCSEGEIIAALAPHLSTIEAQIALLEQQRQTLRATLEQAVSRLDGQKTELAGFGTLAIMGGGVSVSWDSRTLESLQASLLRAGDAETAGLIALARKETPRRSSLRITREKS